MFLGVLFFLSHTNNGKNKNGIRDNQNYVTVTATEESPQYPK